MADNKTTNEKVIIMCDGSRCAHNKSQELIARVNEELAAKGLSGHVRVCTSGCQGFCNQGPIMIVNPEFTIYGGVQSSDIEEIIDSHVVNDKVVDRLAIKEDHLYNRFFKVFGDVGFFGKQMRICLRNCGIIDPENIDEYFSVRGYEALAKVLSDMAPEQVIAEVKKSGLRGRGGGGFSAGMKWEFTAKAESELKYVVCNADEGDPGAFMDRSSIEGDPHSLIEGMSIGGYATGASRGIVYIRAEYPLAISRLEIAIADARKHGLLGKNIMGSDFSFDIEIRLGAGAFVCGEETALIHSIEGQRGVPRPRPPFPAVKGVFGYPTVLNNVETWFNVPVIILDGADWFSSIGTEKSKGTKVFALAGNVKNTGLIEVPMGTTLRDIIFDIGGGISNGKKFKAVQTGGPAGGCLPEEYLDTPIDYDSLIKAGSMMGSGGMIVADEDNCMVNLAKFFMDFIRSESCGKCVPCREGTRRMYDILELICAGKAEMGHIDELESLGKVIIASSLCGLGKAAPNPILSTLRYFRHEYEEHINEKKCRASVCKDLLSYEIIDSCIGCGACKRACPTSAIRGEVKAKHVIDQAKCIKCGQCFATCKFSAIIR
ncbi:MAG: NADH-quinone oxidoreductase subunit F [Candidatus Margulisiibacteriota bacterium]|nr:MAG: NADH dehydrogenase [Candidatus Margulisbacteria bacterium GWD2_39_127]PZM84884.1 MAG: NADH-quinone oxidoreductase subunit F [Candidatus Margulisiibacteriota bacterium]HAR64030.1 NADH-quinone oxidoreductase subunit F [Candidatus Margulisiibacteriota bacterium]HCY38202.1 NADH-quinone oxidoreductase subunit F [Candidatus Margulisiibacteriota bacterium]